MHLPVKVPEGLSSRRSALAGCETSGIRWLFVLLLLGSTLGAFGQERPALAGRSLADALAVLEAQGLRLVYTDELVRPEMVVVREPSRRDLRGALLEILQPHGLGVLDGPGGTLIVVAEVQPLAAGRVRGRVRWRNSESVVAGAEVLLEPGEVLHRTDSDGLFSFDGLAPGAYRLSVSSSRGGIGTFVPQTVEVELAAGSTVDLVVEVVAVPISSERIDVFSLGGKAPGDELAVVSLGRDETESLPTLGQDVFRNLSLLPGATGAELSARPQIRGGREDEVLVRLDGLEILEAYHLKDFGSALSIVPGTVVAQVRLLSGGFPVEFGERMSGVLDLSSGIPESRHGTTLGLGIFQASASHSREIAGGQGQFLGILRYGYLQLPLQLADQPEDPQFWDGFGRLDRTLSQGHGLRVNLLASGDRLSFREDTEEEKEAFRTSYQNQYLWLTDQWLPTSRLLFESRVSLSLVDTRRDVEVDLEDGSFTVADDRRLETPALAHDGYLEAGKVQHMKWGLDLRYLDVDYGYRNERNLTTPLAALRAQPAAGETVFDQGFHGSQIGAYVSDRLTWSKVSLEAGWRYDENSVTDDEYLSPRLDLSWQLGSVSRLRVAWGHFYQSQRLYELEVADGVDQFQPAERAEHRVASLQHRFDTGARRPLTLRIELYERKVENPRHRFENLADPVSKVPELEPDRVLLEPQSSRARGVELFGSGALREVDWFFSYTYSESRDRIDGKWVPRFNDQPHAFALDLRYRLGKSWDFNLALQGRSGWPITRIGVETGVGEDGEPVALPTLGPLYGERLGDYLRADLQARKRWRLRRGALELEINLINLTNRRNPRGVELDFEIEDGEAVVRRTQKTWQGLLPNLDLSWSF